VGWRGIVAILAGVAAELSGGPLLAWVGPVASGMAGGPGGMGLVRARWGVAGTGGPAPDGQMLLGVAARAQSCSRSAGVRRFHG